MKIRTRFTLSFAAIALLCGLLGFIPSLFNKKLYDRIDLLIESNFGELTNSNQSAYHIQRVKSNLRELFLSEAGGDPKEIQYLKEEIRKSLKVLSRSIEGWKKAIELAIELEKEENEEGEKTEHKELEEVKEIESAAGQFTADSEKIIRLYEQQGNAAARNFFEEGAEGRSRKLQRLVFMSDEAAKGELHAEVHGIRLASWKSAYFALFLTGLVILAAMGVYLFSSGMVRALYELRNAMLAFAKDQMEIPVDDKRADEIGDLARAFKSMRQDLLKAQRAMVQSEKMSAIGQLAGGVAHEINNPLGVILGFSQNAVRRLQPGDPLEIPLKSIEREAVRCRDLVQNLLTFSRVHKTEKKAIDPRETIESALLLVQAQSKVKNVELIKKLLEVSSIVANKNQIQQVIVNLCNNAIDAMPEGGSLTIRLREAKLDSREAVEIQVQDTGQGIPKEIQSEIYNPFFTTKEIGKGTGLGLSLVYEIIGKHEGKISFESEIGRGTTFRIFLPIKPA